jgi:prophage regulatory protein
MTKKPHYISDTGRRLLRRSEVTQRVGLGRSAIYAKIKDATFPAPVNIGDRAVAWLSDEISAWIDECVTASRPMTGGK